jgi:hypothetical protein
MRRSQIHAIRTEWRNGNKGPRKGRSGDIMYDRGELCQRGIMGPELMEIV